MGVILECRLPEQVAVVQFSNDVRVEVHPRNMPLHELKMRLEDLVRTLATGACPS